MIDEQDETLFKEFPPNENETFSSINGTSLLDLIILLKTLLMHCR